MGYRPDYSDPYLWLRIAVKSDGFEYYEYIISYVDNVLCIYHNQRKLMKRIQEDFKLKGNTIEPPFIYLGATLSNMKLERGKYCWTISPEQYVKAAVTNVEEDLSRSRKILLLKFVTLLLSNYAPWMKDSPELMAYGVKPYQELIGTILWAVDIGSLDILL